MAFIETLGVFWILIIIAAFIFWIWMFIDMLSSKKLKKQTKGVWSILFLTAWIITAFVWLIVKK